jgi:hypothetical protein
VGHYGSQTSSEFRGRRSYITTQSRARYLSGLNLKFEELRVLWPESSTKQKNQPSRCGPTRLTQSGLDLVLSHDRHHHHHNWQVGIGRPPSCVRQVQQKRIKGKGLVIGRVLVVDDVRRGRPDLSIIAPDRCAARMPGTGPLRRSSAAIRNKAIVGKVAHWGRGSAKPKVCLFLEPPHCFFTLGWLELKRPLGGWLT